MTRQSFAVVDGANNLLAGVSPKSTYDPVTRTVTIFGPDGPGRAWLIPGQPYKLVLLRPQDQRSDVGGYRAIDRAPLDPKQTAQFVFRAGPPTGATELEPTVDFCRDVLPVFTAKCSGSTCHGASPTAAAGLVLASAAGIAATALGRVAHGANVDARSSTVVPTPSLFGTNMAIIAPGDPGSSWLTYKIELAAPAAAGVGDARLACFPLNRPAPEPAADLVALAPAATTASDAERLRLGDFVLGAPMPYPTPATTLGLTLQERERIRLWIARGAAVDTCTACEVAY